MQRALRLPRHRHLRRAAACAPPRVRSASRPALLIKALRGRRAGPLAQARRRTGGASSTRRVTAGVRLGLGAADLLHGMRRHADDEGRARRPAQGVAADGCRSGRRRCARPMHFVPSRTPARRGAERVVYFPSCAARNMGAQRGDDGETLPSRGRAPVPARRLRRRLSGRARRPVLRPAVREQGPGRRRRPASRRSSSARCARRARAAAGRSSSTPARAPTG